MFRENNPIPPPKEKQDISRLFHGTLLSFFSFPFVPLFVFTGAAFGLLKLILTMAKNNMTGWWLNQPIWKICSSKWESSPNRGENKKYLKPPPRWILSKFWNPLFVRRWRENFQVKRQEVTLEGQVTKAENKERGYTDIPSIENVGGNSK